MKIYKLQHKYGGGIFYINASKTTPYDLKCCALYIQFVSEEINISSSILSEALGHCLMQVFGFTKTSQKQLAVKSLRHKPKTLDMYHVRERNCGIGYKTLMRDLTLAAKKSEVMNFLLHLDPNDLCLNAEDFNMYLNNPQKQSQQRLLV